MIPTLLEQVLAARVAINPEAVAVSAAREAKIQSALNAIRKSGKASAMQVAKQVGLSDKTARDVLHELEKRGQLRSHKSSQSQPRVWRLIA